MLKVKHERDCDCVVAGFRWHKNGEGTAVGSLLLGLYNGSGSVQHGGVCASFSQAKRREVVENLGPYCKDPLVDPPRKREVFVGAHRMPGGQSPWTQGKGQ